MDLSSKRQEDDATRETSGGSCHTCRQTTWVVVGAIATIILVMGVSLSLILFVRWTASSEVDQTSKAAGLMDRLQLCQKEQSELNLMLHAVTQDSRCNLCPNSWRWWRGHCYFFSVGLEVNRQWNESTQFCQQYNSSLAVIKDSAEMEFIQGVLQKFAHFPFLWVGLTDSEQEGQWLWSDGADVHHYMPVTVEWDTDDRDCADLRGGGSLFAADCKEHGPWVCKKES